MTATLECPAPPEVKEPRSGGPRTQAGKDASRRNALKHGIATKSFFRKTLPRSSPNEQAGSTTSSSRWARMKNG